MGVGEAMGVSPPGIGVSWAEGGARLVPWVTMRELGGSRLAQTTVVEDFGGRRSMLGRISFLLFERRDKMRERKNAKIYHSLRAD
jgi:hypothetical protein